MTGRLSLPVPTRVDKRFVGDCGGLDGLATEMLPFGIKVVMAQKHQSAFLAAHGMGDSEGCTTAIALLGQAPGGEPVAEPDAVAKFITRQIRSVKAVGRHR